MGQLIQALVCAIVGCPGSRPPVEPVRPPRNLLRILARTEARRRHVLPPRDFRLPLDSEDLDE